MPRSGLNKQIVLETAICLIEEKGFQNFSMRELARKLDVKAASLYNHIESMDELLSEVGAYAVGLLNETELSAIKGLNGDAAVWALAKAYRHFAKEHPELYNVIMSLFKSHKAIIEKSGMLIAVPFMQVLNDYPLDDAQKAHWQRVLRSILHGFLSQEDAGYFSHYPINEEHTFELGVQCYIDGLHAFIINEKGVINQNENE